MNISFDKISDNARIWVCPARQNLTHIEAEIIAMATQRFLEKWDSHGNALLASIKLFHRRFLVLAVDEEVHAPKGCAEDKFIALLHELSDVFTIHFLDRDQVNYFSGEEMRSVSLDEFKEQVQHGEVSADTLVYDNTITRKSDLEHRWLVPVKDTWLKRYLETDL